MKSILCLLIAAGFGAVLQSLGVGQRDGIGHVAEPWRVADVSDRADSAGGLVADARGRVESH